MSRERASGESRLSDLGLSWRIAVESPLGVRGDHAYRAFIRPKGQDEVSFDPRRELVPARARPAVHLNTLLTGQIRKHDKNRFAGTEFVEHAGRIGPAHVPNDEAVGCLRWVGDEVHRPGQG